MKIKDIELRVISDSRGEATLEARLKTENFSVVSSAPSGKSRGTHEAFAAVPSEAVLKFSRLKEKILPFFIQADSQKTFDRFLISFDGTENKKNLGGNTMIVLSMAFARASAKANNQELFHYLRSVGNFPANVGFPRPIFNVINGGVHADNNLEIQEFQVIPQTKDFGIALSMGKEFYRKLEKELEKKFGKENISLGNEAGFSAPFENNEQAIEILNELISKNNYPMKIGIDAAASQFLKRRDAYIVGGKEFSGKKLLEYYLGLIERYDIVSVEDPFGEEEFELFAGLKKEIEKTGKEILLITDDLTVTNPGRLEKAIKKNSGNAVLIKPNQIGTITETIEVIKMARDCRWQTIISHRSGETEDDFIADLSFASSSWGIKSGAPAKIERLKKYERLLSIYNNRMAVTG